MIIDQEHPDNSLSKKLGELQVNEKLIMHTVREAVLDDFRVSNMYDSRYSEEKILNFIKSSEALYDNGHSMAFSVYVPWLHKKYIHLEIGENGDLQEMVYLDLAYTDD